MSDIKLFRVSPGAVEEVPGEGYGLEKSLQTLIERHLETFLGVRFLASEYSTGARHKGRIDTLGVDENGCPVIIEYKRSSNENVINQGLFYLDWLLDHKAEFKWLVMERLGVEEAQKIEWSDCRLICIAGDFKQYDEHAVQQINRNIALIRYRRYGDELLLFELVNEVTGAASEEPGASAKSSTVYKGFVEYLGDASQELTDLFHTLRSFLLNIGDDVQEKQLKYYLAFKRIKNFACVEVHPKSQTVLVYAKVHPDEVDVDSDPMLRDVRSIGHYGTGDLEIRITSMDELRRAEPILEQAYENA